MRKNINTCRIVGYVYDSSKLKAKVTGEKSKKPGTPFISGDLEIAVDEDGLNVVSVHFTYVAEYYASGKKNNTYPVLNEIITREDATWISGGKDKALRVQIDGVLDVNDFVTEDRTTNETRMVSAKRCEGKFVSFAGPNAKNESSFKTDILLTHVSFVEADPEKNIDKDYVVLKGAVFSYRNELLPVELVVKNPQGVQHFLEADISPSEPLYTKVWGNIVSETIQVETQNEETAWGELPAVTSFERRRREWVVTGTSKYPYDFGEEDILTTDEVKEMMQNREVYLADVKKRYEDYVKTRDSAAATNGAKTAVKKAEFNF